jgi:hypothetical protein
MTQITENKNSVNVYSEETHKINTYNFVFYEVTHDFVIKILNGCPPYSFLNVFFLYDRNQNTHQKHTSEREKHDVFPQRLGTLISYFPRGDGKGTFHRLVIFMFSLNHKTLLPYYCF